ncbi:hypothetical protein [Nonomuraea sp. NPDC050202]|uniref:DUF6197 family protein n=1 Tax=Nonomuraea sp. NPDC050202 TaxID=3155035 RepID=UPI0033FC9E00
MNAETILNAAQGVLQRRGMCAGNFTIVSGEVDAFGALAIAGGFEPDVWMGLREWHEIHWEPGDHRLVDAAYLLAEQVLPGRCVAGMPLDDLITDAGDRLDAMSPDEVLDAFTKAAHVAGEAARLAEKAGAAT